MSIIAGSTQQLFIEQIEKQFALIQQHSELYPFTSVESMSRFSKSGLPTTKNEEWKYTNTEPFLRYDYSLPSSVSNEGNHIGYKYSPAFKCHTLVFVNGFFQRQHSQLLNDDDSLELLNIKELIANNTNVLKQADEILPQDGWKYLNDAFVLDGICLRIKKNRTARYPIHILNISDANNKPLLLQNRFVLLAESKSEATILESFLSIGFGVSLSNIIEHIDIANDARLTFIKLQQLHQSHNNAQSLINYTSALLHERAHFKIFTLALGGSLIRNNLHVKMAGVNSEAFLNGLYTPNGKQLIDNHTLVDHAVPNCYSNELYKGIVDDSAKAIFNGKILVRKDAQRTNAFQSNKNILLTREASVYTKPQLEIFADDVKCSHGATSGQLDDESLFYLQARGISKVEAQKMLMLAFAEDIISTISNDEIKHHLNNTIEKSLK
jgi:Fe-S cluster assembly protein SufD